MIRFTQKGDFENINRFLEKSKELFHAGELDKYGKMGVEALKLATPKNTGKTAESWDYIIERGSGQTKITWINTNMNKGVNIAVIIQYGHGTRTGGFVTGVDYINPAMKPVFNEIADSIIKEVKLL